MRKKVIDLIVACILLLSVSGSLVFAYLILGKPVSLHHNIERIFDNRISYYNLEGDTLTVVADNAGWDGSGWSARFARTEGERQIKALYDTVPEYNDRIKSIHLTITYLDNAIMTQTLNLK